MLSTLMVWYVHYARTHTYIVLMSLPMSNYTKCSVMDTKLVPKLHPTTSLPRYHRSLSPPAALYQGPLIFGALQKNFRYVCSLKHGNETLVCFARDEGGSGLGMWLQIVAIVD